MTKYNPRSLARLLITCLSLCLALWLPLTSVQAGVLLDLVNPPGQNNTPYALTFTATLPVTTLALSGYQQPAALWTTDNGVFLNGAGANLLAPTWTYSPAASGADAYVRMTAHQCRHSFLKGPHREALILFFNSLLLPSVTATPTNFIFRITSFFRIRVHCL